MKVFDSGWPNVYSEFLLFLSTLIPLFNSKTKCVGMRISDMLFSTNALNISYLFSFSSTQSSQSSIITIYLGTITKGAVKSVMLLCCVRSVHNLMDYRGFVVCVVLHVPPHTLSQASLDARVVVPVSIADP